MFLARNLPSVPLFRRLALAAPTPATPAARGGDAEAPDEPDLVALRVVAEGRRQGRPATLTWELLDRVERGDRVTAMMRCTGYSLSVVGLLLGRGRIGESGVFPPDRALPADEYLAELAARGVEVRLREESA